jgi:hypothetical protein
MEAETETTPKKMKKKKTKKTSISKRKDAEDDIVSQVMRIASSPVVLGALELVLQQLWPRKSSRRR